jgi:aminoglycoside/choline kinase family phosphotransferase
MTEASELPVEVTAALQSCLGDGWSATRLPGDASVRVYYRVTTVDGSTHMLSWYPPEVRQDLTRVLSAYRAASKHAYLPKLMEYGEAAMLQQDVGDQTLFDLLQRGREEGVRWYRKAVTLLAYFQKAGAVDINRPFTGDFFFNELEMSRQFYVEKLMGVCAADAGALPPLLRRLADSIARHPYVLCHRDYHGQNIHIFNEKLYLIDYQDLRMGPDTYDIASLLRDRGVARILGKETELELVDYYAEWRVHGLPARNELTLGERRSMRRRYFETLLQRSIKILGTFSKQPLTRGRMWYLDFIPPTLESVRRCIDELPEYGSLATLLPMDFSLATARERAERIHHGANDETQDHASAR